MGKRTRSRTSYMVPFHLSSFERNEGNLLPSFFHQLSLQDSHNISSTAQFRGGEGAARELGGCSLSKAERSLLLCTEVKIAL